MPTGSGLGSGGGVNHMSLLAYQPMVGPQKKVLLRQQHLSQMAKTMSEKETSLWEACVLRCCLQTAPLGGLPLSRLLEVLDHITFLQGVTKDDNHKHSNHNHNNNHDHHIISLSRSAQERSEKLDIARRRLCSDVESLKLTIHRLQSQGEVEVVLVNSTAVQNDNNMLLPSSSVDGMIHTSASSSSSTSNNKGGSVEICVRLIGELLPIHDSSNDERYDSNSTHRVKEEGLMFGRLGKLKHAMKYRTNERGGLNDEEMEVVEGRERR